MRKSLTAVIVAASVGAAAIATAKAWWGWGPAVVGGVVVGAIVGGAIASRGHHEYVVSDSFRKSRSLIRSHRRRAAGEGEEREDRVPSALPMRAVGRSVKRVELPPKRVPGWSLGSRLFVARGVTSGPRGMAETYVLTGLGWMLDGRALVTAGGATCARSLSLDTS